MNNRARLLTHMAVLRTCSRVALCHKCHCSSCSRQPGNFPCRLMMQDSAIPRCQPMNAALIQRLCFRAVLRAATAGWRILGGNL